MLALRAGIRKMVVRIASREDPDQCVKKQSDLGLRRLSKLFGRHLVFDILEHLP